MTTSTGKADHQVVANHAVTAASGGRRCRSTTRTVRHLERDGLVARTAFAEVPPRVEYELTAMGRTLIEPAVALAEWAVDHNPDIARNQTGYDARHPEFPKNSD